MDAATEMRGSAGAPRARWALALACALPIACACAPRDLWSPDEPRYGRVAHEMVATGDWTVPRLNGLAYPEKPPLVFWMQAAVETALGGRSPVGARLPAALLAALATFLVARFATKRLGGESVGDTAAIVFATTALVLWNSPRAGLDLPIAAFGLLALEGGAAAMLERSWGGAVRFGLGIGLGLLAKGPHALYLPIGGLVGGAIWAGRGRALRSPQLALGLLLGAALFLGWLLPALATHGDDLTANGQTYRARLLGQIGSRVGGEDEPHAHGPLFLLGLVFPMGLPWTAAAVLGLLHAFRTRARDRGPARFGAGAATCGLLVPLLLLSVPASKRELYLIPALAAAALLAAHALHAAPLGPARRVARFAGVLAGLLAIGCAAAPFFAAKVDPADPLDAASGADLARGLPLLGLGATALVLCACELAASRRGDAVRAARTTGAGLAVGAALLFLFVMPAYDPAKSTVAVARIVDAQGKSVRFAIAGTSDLTSLWNVDRPRADRIGPDAAGLAAALSPTAPPTVVLVKRNHWRGLRERPDVPAADRARLEHARVLWEGNIGGTGWMLVTGSRP
jgi:4-amino-4-deoxy-L-arabinose transferase-like glycosyltransferase